MTFGSMVVMVLIVINIAVTIRWICELRRSRRVLEDKFFKLMAQLEFDRRMRERQLRVMSYYKAYK